MGAGILGVRASLPHDLVVEVPKRGIVETRRTLTVCSPSLVLTARAQASSSLFRHRVVSRQAVDLCPGWGGGKNWPAGAYSPLTNTMCYPMQNTCARVLATPDEGLAIYQLASRFQLAPGTDQLGAVWAISAETGETTWLYEQRAATYSLVTTGGGLLFGGDGNGRFRAFDQETGEVLWEINLGSPVSGFPITYAVDGRQYVAASTSGRVSGLTPELRPSVGNNLFVFALPERD